MSLEEIPPVEKHNAGQVSRIISYGRIHKLILGTTGTDRMIFSRKMSTGNVISLCRALRHSLGAGLTLVQVFRQQAERGGTGVRPMAQRVLKVLEGGHGLSEALDEEKKSLPPLFLSMTRLGEETGHLAEIYAELEKYYLLQESLRKQFRSQSIGPLIQLCVAFCIVAALIFILGMLTPPGRPPNGLFGLSGASGACIFLVLSFGTVALVWVGLVTFGRWARRKPRTDRVLTHIPVIGPCLEALTMGRLCMALHLTLDSGLPIARALQLGLRASGSAAYIDQTQTVCKALENGVPLTDALARTGVFSGDFLSIVAVGEESGRIPEVMRQQALYWNEEAANRLKIAVKLLGMLIWLLYAGFMITAIFNVASKYFNAIGI
jgi:type IV pilus assembly protein PilC